MYNIVHSMSFVWLTEIEHNLRTPSSYDHACEVLLALGDKYHTTTFGINRPSALNRLQYFHVCDFGLPPDLMNDVLEGYLPYLLKLMINHFKSKKFLTLDNINSSISNFVFGITETSRPHLLTDQALSLDSGCTTFPFSGM